MMRQRRSMLAALASAVPPYQTLEAMSWPNIALVAAAGLAPTYWAVGDMKTITLGATVLGSTSITVEIIGFGHDDLTAGGKASITFGMVNCFNTTQQMNTTPSNVGGWGGSKMRAFVRADIWNALPSDLRTAIKEVNKYTSEGNKSSTINTTVDTLFLFSDVEVFGVLTSSFAGEGLQYSRFMTASTRIRKIINTASAWFERSPHSSNAGYFTAVSATGTATSAVCDALRGVALGFCV